MESMCIQALASARTAVGKLEEAAILWHRPPDYYAEMVKSDGHMSRIKEQLVYEQKQIEQSEERYGSIASGRNAFSNWLQVNLLIKAHRRHLIFPVSTTSPVNIYHSSVALRTGDLVITVKYPSLCRLAASKDEEVIFRIYSGNDIPCNLHDRVSFLLVLRS